MSNLEFKKLHQLSCKPFDIFGLHNKLPGGVHHIAALSYLDSDIKTFLHNHGPFVWDYVVSTQLLYGVRMPSSYEIIVSRIGE